MGVVQVVADVKHSIPLFVEYAFFCKRVTKGLYSFLCIVLLYC